MGFTDNYTKKASANSTTSASGARLTGGGTAANVIAQTFPINFCDEDDDDDEKRGPLIPDQEILDSIEEIYFDPNADIGIYELNVSVINGSFDDDSLVRYSRNHLTKKLRCSIVFLADCRFY